MLKSLLLLFSILMINSLLFAQQSDLEKWGVKGSARQTNYYDSYDVPYPDPKNNPPSLRLSTISVFNRLGNVILQFGFSGYDKDCSYKKTVYAYDRKNRKKEMTIFESGKDASFCIAAAPLLERDQTAAFEGQASLTEKTVYEYDADGHLVRETIFDRDGQIILENKSEYDARGHFTRYTTNQQRNRISGMSGAFVKTIDSRMIYSQNDRLRETYRYEDGKLISKTVDHLDAKEQIVKEVQYRIETDERNNIVKETITSASSSVFEGTQEFFDWAIYENGRHTQQLYLLLENDNELLRIEYAHRETLKDRIERSSHYRFDQPGGAEINRRLKDLLKFDRLVDNPEWVAKDLEATFYKFDARGNIVESANIQQHDPKEKIDRQSIYKKEIVYYR